jgi:hypothetical protein
MAAMNTNLDRLTPPPKKGDEKFRADGEDLHFTLKDFWIWSVSDLVSNATRGRLAEFIVAKALDIGTDAIRDEWESFDLKTLDGLKIQVKSAAYIQGWKQKKLSAIIFPTRPTRFWDSETGELEKEKKRHADVYVFALLAHEEKLTIDPMNVKQWEFYVLSASFLNGYKRSQDSTTLKTLKDLKVGPKELKAGPVDYFQLAEKVRSALA